MKSITIGLIRPPLVERLRHFLESANGPVKLIFNSPGGSVKAALEIYDLISAHAKRWRVIGQVKTRADSAALLILQACPERLAHKSATFLFHPLEKKATIIFDGTISRKKFRRLADDIWRKARKLQKAVTKILSHHSGLGARYLEAWCDCKHRLSAEQSLAMGFLTKIIDPLP